MPGTDTLNRGREALARQAWGEAYERLAAADREAPLEPQDRERLAVAAHLIGKDAECAELWARAHHQHLERHAVERAVRCAFWLGFGLLMNGQRARGSGWLARARRLLDDGRLECAERGFLLLPAALEALSAGDPLRADATFAQAIEIGDRFGDRELATLGRLGRGQALIRMGSAADGVALLDEVMAGLEAGDLSPVVVGTVYCAVIEACWEIFDLSRAQEWTGALARWCASQPDLVPYRGQCQVRRAEIMQIHGEWAAALDEAGRACARLDEPPGQPAAGAAFYRRGELYRLRGDFARAEEAYREASRRGREPQPGLAQLRLAQGRVAAAAAALGRALRDTQEREVRCALLPVQVEIMLAAGDIAAARHAADELAEIAAALNALLPRARAAGARGAVLVAEGDMAAALDALRDARAAWEALDAPYEAARVRGLMGAACRALGDEDGAALELDGARTILRGLGAAPDLARIEAHVAGDGRARAVAGGADPGSAHGGLTRRELEVLRLVATGKTNRAIGAELFISEKTVIRHVSNILGKLGLSSRSAATAWAYEHELARPSST